MSGRRLKVEKGLWRRSNSSPHVVVVVVVVLRGKATLLVMLLSLGAVGVLVMEKKIFN